MPNSFDCHLFHFRFEFHMSLYISQQNDSCYSKICTLYEYQISLRSRKRNLISCGGVSHHRPQLITPKGIMWK